MGAEIEVGEVRWHWATNVVCAGPEGRLVVIRALGATAKEAREALQTADRMEWRDKGFRRWRIRRSTDGVTFVSHYEILGPVPLDADEPLASLSNETLELLLAEARLVGVGSEGTQVRPRT